MMKRVKILSEYYTNLNYDNNKEKALEEIRNLSKTVTFHNRIDLPERMETLADIIQDNMSHFKSVCRNVDVINTIVQYLNVYAGEMKFLKDCLLQENSTLKLETMFQMLCMILATLFNICKESEIRSFLLHFICTNFYWDVETILTVIKYWQTLIDLETKIIILKDSDLNAVINYLITTDNFSSCKIWVQEQIKEKFLWLMKRHNLDLFTIDTFRLLKDIPHVCQTSIINIVSIWSEDIVAMKNLAQSLKSHIIFINAHMDFFGSMALFPYKQIFNQMKSQVNLREIHQNNENEFGDSTDTEQNVHISHIAEMNNISIYNLFYDGTWQEPVKGMYWKHNNNLWANATNDDILRCYESAEKGFEIWSMKSIQTRIQILSKFLPILKLKGKPVLVAIVEKWLKFSYIFSCIQGKHSRNRLTEVTYMRMPLGVIILKEKNENVLFFRLILTLIAGNSVIVIFDANLCNLTAYCDMFSICGIPPGVINLLSHEDTNVLEYRLCSENYTNYASNFFLKGNSKDTYITQYLNLTIIKNIILHFE